MSWSTRQQTSFATQGATLRRSTLTGATDAYGNNLSYTDADSVTHPLRLAFNRYDQTRELEDGGYRHQVDAVALLPTSLGLTLALGAQLTHLTLAETYRVDGIGSHPVATEQKLLLRRVNG